MSGKNFNHQVTERTKRFLPLCSQDEIANENKKLTVIKYEGFERENDE